MFESSAVKSCEERVRSRENFVTLQQLNVEAEKRTLEMYKEQVRQERENLKRFPHNSRRRLEQLCHSVEQQQKRVKYAQETLQLRKNDLQRAKEDLKRAKADLKKANDRDKEKQKRKIEKEREEEKERQQKEKEREREKRASMHEKARTSSQSSNSSLNYSASSSNKSSKYYSDESRDYEDVNPDKEIYLQYCDKVEEFNYELVQSLKKTPSVHEIVEEYRIACENADRPDEKVPSLEEAANLLKPKVQRARYRNMMDGKSGRQEIWNSRKCKLERIVREKPEYWTPEIRNAFPQVMSKISKYEKGQVAWTTCALSSIVGGIIWWNAISGFWTTTLFIIIMLMIFFMMFSGVAILSDNIDWKFNSILDRYKRYSLKPLIIVVYIICAWFLIEGLTKLSNKPNDEVVQTTTELQDS